MHIKYFLVRKLIDILQKAYAIIFMCPLRLIFQELKAGNISSIREEILEGPTKFVM